MKVLITGAAGFIGSNLLHLLAAERNDWKLHALDLLTYAGNLENIGSLLKDNNIAFSKLDINDSEAMESLFKEESFDMVFHLAAESHVDRSIHGAAAFVQTNVLGTQNLLQAARKSGVKRFVHVSTDEVYGALGPTGRFYETTPLDPTSPYSASKASSDLLALAYHKTYGMDVVVTRCTNNYGPYQFPEKFIPLFVTNAMEDKKLPLYGDGMQIRSWLYVTDHCEALLMVAEKGRSGEVYNIGADHDSELPNKTVAEVILSLLGKPVSLMEHVTDRPAHDRRYAVDTGKINKELGWRPGTRFDEGIRRTVDWYRTNTAWWGKIKTGEYLKFYEKNYGNRK